MTSLCTEVQLSTWKERFAALSVTLTRCKDDLIRISDGENSYALAKMSQKYERNPSKVVVFVCDSFEIVVPADKDVQKLSFFLIQKKVLMYEHLGLPRHQMEVVYHQDNGKITSSTRTYTKDGKTRGFQVIQQWLCPTVFLFRQTHSPKNLLSKSCMTTSCCSLQWRRIARSSCA
jgi:hypothetical protein